MPKKKTFICGKCGYVGPVQHGHPAPREKRRERTTCSAFASIQVEHGFSFGR